MACKSDGIDSRHIWFCVLVSWKFWKDHDDGSNAAHSLHCSTRNVNMSTRIQYTSLDQLTILESPNSRT